MVAPCEASKVCTQFHIDTWYTVNWETSLIGGVFLFFVDSGDVEMKLTERQKRFVDYYLELGSFEQAAIKAGYSKAYARGNAHKMVANVSVSAYLQQRQGEIESARIAQAAEVMTYLTAVLRGESESEIVVVEGSGDGCSSARRVMKAPDEKDKLRAAELLGKRYRMFTDNVNLDGGFQINFTGEENLTD